MENDTASVRRGVQQPSPRRIKRANEVLKEIPKQGLITAFNNGSGLTGPQSRPTSVLSVNSNMPGTVDDVETSKSTPQVRKDSIMEENDDLSGDDTDLEDGPIGQLITPDYSYFILYICIYSRH